MNDWFELAEDVLIVRMSVSTQIAEEIPLTDFPEIIDIIVTDNEVAVQHCAKETALLVDRLTPFLKKKIARSNRETFVIPVCYDYGLDWSEVEQQVGLLRSEIERIHMENIYEVSYGFSPGFLYLTGLDDQLYCKRKENPRQQIPKGSLGIGGSKTGIYGLDSPGGWQIIGRTPLSMFDPDAQHPVPIPNGAKVQLKSITKEEFLLYGSA